MLVMSFACSSGQPVEPRRELIAPGEQYLALSSSSLGLYGLTSSGTLKKVGSGRTPAIVGDPGGWRDNIAAVPEQRVIYTLEGGRLYAYDVDQADPAPRPVHLLHTTDLAAVDGRLLTLDCSNISVEEPDGGRTPLLRVDSCITTYLFAARGRWLAHEMNGVMTVTHLDWSRSWPVALSGCLDFLITEGFAWCLHFTNGDAGTERHISRVSLPLSREGAPGAPELRHTTAEYLFQLHASGAAVGWRERFRDVQFDDGTGVRSLHESGLVRGLAFDGDRSLVYSVEDAGVVRLTF